MSKTSVALRRLGVGALSAATIGSGLVAFAATPALAAAATTVTSIQPTSAAADNNDSGSGTGYCQTYEVSLADAGGAAPTSGTLTVTANPSSGLDVDFCSGPGSGYPVDGGAGQPDTATFTISGDTVTFGVQAVPDANTPSATAAGTGTATITAFIDSNSNLTPDAGESSKSASLTVVSATNQNEVVNTLKVDQTSVSNTPTSNNSFTVTALRGSDTVGDALVRYIVKDSQGATVTPATDCGSTSPLDGTVTCDVATPTPTPNTTPPSTGPYTVTFFVPQACAGNGGAAPTSCEPTTTATINAFAAPAAGTATIAVSCGGTSTERTSSSQCAEPTSVTSETFTATVNSTATGSAPLQNVVVDWTVACTTTGDKVAGVTNTNGCTTGAGTSATYAAADGTTGTATLTPTSCVTAANGSCSTTLKLSKPAADGVAFDVTGTIKDYSTGTSTTAKDQDTASVIFTNKFQAAPTNVSVTAAKSSPTVGTTDTVTAQVTNQFGNAAGSGTNVTFTISGAGRFTNGTTQQTVATGPNGQAQVAITSNSTGSSTITATLDPSTGCSGTGGQCTDSTTVTWKAATTPPPTTKRAIEHPVLNCWSPRKHVVHCRVYTRPRVEGATVVLRIVQKDGTTRIVRQKLTGSLGRATFAFHHLKSGVVKRYVAHVRHTATTRAADTNHDKVRVK